jgi:phage anti-repressor protein
MPIIYFKYMSKQIKQIQLTERRQVVTHELPIIQQGENVLISALLLHKKLKVKTNFTTWLNRRIEKYGFEKNIDYFPNLESEKQGRGNFSTDYLLSLDMAKEIAMLEENEIGRKIRKYFIAKEKELRGISNLPKSQELFKGLKSKRINDRLMYPYREVLVRCGYSPNANGNRKARYWMHFVKDGLINYVTQDFALHLHHSRQVWLNRKTMLAASPVLPMGFGDASQLNLFSNG